MATTPESRYKRIHADVRSVKGDAGTKPCEWCGRPADEWAYDHRDPNEVFAGGYLFSETTTAHYFPLCRRDHRAFDAAFRRHGRARLDVVAAELKAEARKRYSDETKAAYARLCDERSELAENVYNVALNFEIAEHAQQQAELRARLARDAFRRLMRSLTDVERLQQFFPGALEAAEGSTMPLSDVLSAYARWYDEQGGQACFKLNRRTLVKAFGEIGIAYQRGQLVGIAPAGQ